MHDIEEITINSFISHLNKNESIKGFFFYYASSQYPIYKSFAKEALLEINEETESLHDEFLDEMLGEIIKRVNELRKIIKSGP